MSTLYKEDIADVNLDTCNVHRTYGCRLMAEGDENADRFAFRCFRKGQIVSLTNESTSVTGYFIRADGQTVVISGKRSWEKGYVDLPKSCYAVEGNFTLIIKISSPDFTGTMRIVDGTVVNSSNGTFIDPGSVIPSLEDYATAVAEAEEYAEAIGALHISNELIVGKRYRIIVTKDEEET